MHKLKPIPGTEKIEFKQKFIERYSKLTDWEVFRKYNLSFLRKSIRVNTLKIEIEDLKKRLENKWILEQIPWCKEGFWITHKEGRLDVGNTVEHLLGYYYVQESASMIPPTVLDPKPGEVILDMCAAPGSKTSQTAQYMENKGVLIANDITGDRLAALGINLQRTGVSNTIITQMKGEKIAGIKFDKILLDAPCSGTGTIRKSIKTIQMWNPDMMKRIANVQKKLIYNAFELLKDKGTLVYSTCSVEPEEDEGVVDFLLKKYPNAKVEEIRFEDAKETQSVSSPHSNQIDSPVKKSKPVIEFEGNTYNSEVSKCLRLWPQDNDTEGFFVAKIMKE